MYVVKFVSYIPLYRYIEVSNAAVYNAISQILNLGKIFCYGSSSIFNQDLFISLLEVIHFVWRSTNLLILFGIRKNCHSSVRNLYCAYL